MARMVRYSREVIGIYRATATAGTLDRLEHGARDISHRSAPDESGAKSTSWSTECYTKSGSPPSQLSTSSSSSARRAGRCEEVVESDDEKWLIQPAILQLVHSSAGSPLSCFEIRWAAAESSHCSALLSAAIA